MNIYSSHWTDAFLDDENSSMFEKKERKIKPAKSEPKKIKKNNHRKKNTLSQYRRS